MRALLGWHGDLGYIIRIHGQEFNRFRRKTRSKALHELKLHRQEKFLYIRDTLHMWEWDIRVLDNQEGMEGDHATICLGGRGAAPPEFCGGPTGYRMMLKRQRGEAALCDPNLREAAIEMLAEACPEESAGTGIFSEPCWRKAYGALTEGSKSADRSSRPDSISWKAMSDWLNYSGRGSGREHPHRGYRS